MPHDVTMPQLGMAQDAGKIVSWLKAPGDAVSKGDALFEVETDKAVMEVESPADGYLGGVAYDAGEDVPVGQVIARITDSAEDTSAPEKPAAPEPETAAGEDASADALPEGHAVTMPQLGMAQDSGLLVNWLKAPGDKVAAEDILFEVETDKSTMEVEAGRDGWLAATLAHAGEEVPVGDPVAILSKDKPDAPIARGQKDSGAKPAPAAPPAPASEKPENPAAPARKARASAPVEPSGRILASPKARRLALEQGLDLARLVKAGHPQPFHTADLDVLRNLPDTAAPAAAGAAARCLTARCASDGFSPFADWAAEAHGLTDADALLAGMAAASLDVAGSVAVAVEKLGVERVFAVPPGRRLSAPEPAEDAPVLIVRDLRATALCSVSMGAEAVPVLTIMQDGDGLTITLECAAETLDARAATALVANFAGRMEQPLRHLL